jgi:protein TonB
MQHEPGVWASLWSNLRDVFFPVKLPPLVLESKPIPVIDRMATKQNPWATVSAGVIYLIVFGLFLLGANKLHQMAVQKAMQVTELTPPPIDPALNKMGGGGGQRGPAPVSKGRLPEFAKIQITPPAAPPLEEPKIRMPDPTIEAIRTHLCLATRWATDAAQGSATATARGLGRGRGAAMAAEPSRLAGESRGR